MLSDHQKRVKDAVDSRTIIFKGEFLQPQTQLTADETGKPKAQEKPELFFVFTGRDEREPHSFIMSDPLYHSGVIADWRIRELDFIHKERADELMVLGHGK